MSLDLSVYRMFSLQNVLRFVSIPNVFSKGGNSLHSNPGPIHALVCIATLLRCCLLEVKEQILLVNVVVYQQNITYQIRVLIMQTYHTEIRFN